MTSLRIFRAFCLVLVTSMLSLVFEAQSIDPLVAIQQKLNAQFRVTTITSDRSDIVTAGDVVEIHAPGLLMYGVSSPMPPSNNYKNGRIGQGWGGFGKDLAIGMLTPGGGTAANYPHRQFVAGEKCWVTGLQVQKDGVAFQLYSDPYDDIRYYANLKVGFPNKKEVPSVDAAMQLIAEVLTPVAAEGQPAPADSGPPPAMTESTPPYVGKYFRRDKNTDYLDLQPSGSFILIQNGKLYTGQYRVEGDTLIASGSKIRGEQRARLNGNLISDPDGTIWEKPAQPVSASAPAPIPEPVQAPPPPAQPQFGDIAPPPAPALPPPTISIGQTKAQVSAAFGEPMRKAVLGAKEIFVYKDMKVTFTAGKVSDVQ